MRETRGGPGVMVVASLATVKADYLRNALKTEVSHAYLRIG
jgi:hypothetical protein